MTRPSILARVAGARKTGEYRAERLALSFLQSVVGAMKRASVSQRDLANRLGKSDAYVSKVLNAPSNLTLRTISEIADAIDCRVQISIVENRGSIARYESNVVPLRTADTARSFVHTMSGDIEASNEEYTAESVLKLMQSA